MNLNRIKKIKTNLIFMNNFIITDFLKINRNLLVTENYKKAKIIR
jgi:hypothetical protein